MNVYILFFLLPVLLFGHSVDIQQISKQLDRLKNHKKSISVIDYDIYDPFATAKPLLKQIKYKRKKRKKTTIKLQTILNDKVLIKNRWYKVGDKVYGYKITQVGKNSIVVFKNRKRKIIFFEKKKDFIHITKGITQ